MRTTLILLAAASTALIAGSVNARPSSPGEIRGYQNCLAANENDFRGLIPARTYLLEERADERVYYINATAWQDGERVDVGMSCRTSPTGRLLENLGASFTRYVPNAASPVQIARK
jgi:hypothetical protein